MYKIIRLVCLFILVAAVLVVPTSNASAALARCRTDPIFILSNGDMINITLDIGTDAANVRGITYALHVPVGVTVQRVVYTAVNLRLHEMVFIYQDNPAGTYTTATVVTTRRSNRAEVLSMTRLNSVFAKYISGYSGERLMITVGKDESVGWINRE